MKGNNNVAIVFCGMCYTREGEEGTLTKADGGLIEVVLEGKAVDFYACRVCRLGVYAAFHRIMLASGVPEEKTGYLEAVRELESLEEGGDVEHLDETEDIDDVDYVDRDDDVDQEDDNQDIDDVDQGDDDVSQDIDVDDVLDDASGDDAAAEAVIREVAENRPAPAPTGGATVRDAAIVRNLSQAQKRAIRAWGRSQGMKVGERGPIPKEVIDAFFAHNAP